MDTSRLPGYDAWEREVFGLLSEHLGVLFRVFSFYAKLSSVKLLVRYGADVNMKNRWGRTALDDARKYNKQPSHGSAMERSGMGCSS